MLHYFEVLQLLKSVSWRILQFSWNLGQNRVIVVLCSTIILIFKEMFLRILNNQHLWHQDSSRCNLTYCFYHMNNIIKKFFQRYIISKHYDFWNCCLGHFFQFSWNLGQYRAIVVFCSLCFEFLKRCSAYTKYKAFIS